MDFDQPKTKQFQDLYRLTFMWPLPIRHVVLSLLVVLEDKYLHYLTKQRVTEAVEGWHKQEELLNPTVTWRDAQIEEKPSEVAGLPEMRISAPWVDREVGYDRE
jgi:hypothetical protein